MTLCHTLLWNAVQKTYEASINIVVAVHHLKYQLTFPSATWFKTWNLAIITWYLIFVWGFGSFLLSKFRVWLTWHILKYMYEIRMISLQNLLFSIYTISATSISNSLLFSYVYKIYAMLNMQMIIRSFEPLPIWMHIFKMRLLSAFV